MDIEKSENEPMKGQWHVQTAIAEDAGTRIDKWLASWTGLSRTRLRVLIETGQVRIDGDIVTSPTTKVKADIEYALLVPPPVDDTPTPEDIPLDIIYQDDDLIVVNLSLIHI